ncbi:hypothetical protein [Vibrio metschnikovii]|uniref:hypothetical protein n=1 Tax=Vibrio metschnikovii TaxID=28172 RepID=UPI001C2F5A16|nr:hypothetical protein [Vibrio metschnikovii]
MFIKTKEILESSESMLLGFSINRSLLKPVQRLFIYPLVFLKVGFGDFTKPMAVWSFTSFGLFVILAMLSSSIEMSQDIFLILFNICIWGILLLTTFSTPSSYAFYGATETSIKKIVGILDENQVQSRSDIELLESNLEKVEQRIDDRVRFYKWIIGAFWGGYLLMLNFQLRLLSLSGQKLEEEFINSRFEEFSYVVLFTAFALLAMISYKRASNMLIANLQYACVDQKARYPTA